MAGCNCYIQALNKLTRFGFGIWQHSPYNCTKGACEVNYYWVSHLIGNQKCSGRKDIFWPLVCRFWPVFTLQRK